MTCLAYLFDPTENEKLGRGSSQRVAISVVLIFLPTSTSSRLPGRTVDRTSFFSISLQCCYFPFPFSGFVPRKGHGHGLNNDIKRNIKIVHCGADGTRHPGAGMLKVAQK